MYCFYRSFLALLRKKWPMKTRHAMYCFYRSFLALLREKWPIKTRHTMYCFYRSFLALLRKKWPIKTRHAMYCFYRSFLALLRKKWPIKTRHAMYFRLPDTRWWSFNLFLRIVWCFVVEIKLSSILFDWCHQFYLTDKIVINSIWLIDWFF